MEIDSTNIRLEPSRIYCTYSKSQCEPRPVTYEAVAWLIRRQIRYGTRVELRRSQSRPHHVTYDAVAWLIRVGRA
eukprot:scaffold839_cov91-Skeletonema_dohrnii-CCMP3373.AAC.1